MRIMCVAGNNYIWGGFYHFMHIRHSSDGKDT